MGQFQLHIVLFCRLFFIFSFFRIYERSPNLFPSFSPHIVSLPPIPRSPVWRPSSAPPPPAQPSWTKWATASRSNWRSLGQIWGWWRLSRMGMGMGMGMRWWGGGDRGKELVLGLGWWLCDVEWNIVEMMRGSFRMFAGPCCWGVATQGCPLLGRNLKPKAKNERHWTVRARWFCWFSGNSSIFFVF